ncbi:MAG: PstA family ABC transporter permease [Acidimicrobiales bacterium]
MALATRPEASPSIWSRMRPPRGVRNQIFWGLCGLAFLCIMAPALSVIISVFHQAWPDLTWKTLTTPGGGGKGGLENAILGSLLILVGVFVLGSLIGIAAGVWLAEFAPPRLGGVLRFMSEILAGIPSIVLGYVGYLALVVGFHWGYSLLAAWIVLTVLVLPYIVKTTEVAFRQVPSALREGAAGLGLSRTRTVFRILFPPALPAVTSGLIVAMAISTGETAPLLFTAGFSNLNPTLHLTHAQVGYLTDVTYTDVSLPGAAAHAQAAAAGAVSLAILLLLIVAGRLISMNARKASSRMAL